MSGKSDPVDRRVWRFLACLAALGAILAIAFWLRTTDEPSSDCPSSSPSCSSGPRGATAPRTKDPTSALPSEAAKPRLVQSDQIPFWNVLTSTTGKIKEALENQRQYPELAECRKNWQARCQSVLSRAIHLAMVMVGFPQISEEFWKDQSKFEASSMARAVEQVISSSSDPVARSTALAFFDLAATHDARGRSSQLSAPAYAKLDSMLETEQMLLLREYADAPVHDSPVVDQIERLATDAERSPAVRGRALRALANAGNFSAVDDALKSGSFSEASDDAARALSKCASSCADAIERLAGGDGRSRLLALRAAGLMSSAEQKKVVRALTEELPPANQLGFEELDQLRYLARQNGLRVP